MFLVLGKDNLNVRIPEQPVQLKGFKFPDVQHGARKNLLSNHLTIIYTYAFLFLAHKIKNLTVLDVIVDLNKSVYYKLPKSRKSFDPLFRPSDEALEYAQRKSLDILLRLLSECKINFFIIDQHNILFQLIQNLASVPASVQRKILDVCEFVTISLNFLPFKEFVFLLPYLHNNDTEESRETEKNVCQLFHRILSQQPIEFSSAFREAGLQNTLTESIAEGLANLKELDETLPVFANFELKLDLVDLMTNSDYENVALFKKTAATSVFELIKLNKFRTQALKIVKV